MAQNLLRTTKTLVRSARDLRERFLADPYRPGYHFVIPEDLGIPGDPNGAFFANGRYHLMYLYSRHGGAAPAGFCWGHVSSTDLVHWRHHPDAIGPGGGDEGCFSGGAFLDDDGTAYLTYWRLWGDKGIGIARSADPLYEHWEKFPEPAIPATAWGIWGTTDSTGAPLTLACADPSNIWKKAGVYYLQAGNLCVLNAMGRDPANPQYETMRGDWVDLFKSADLHHWEYVHRFYTRAAADRWTDGTEDDMCPSFLPLPLDPEGGKLSDKYLQLFIAHNKGCQYYIGAYDTAADTFIPESHGRMSWVDNTFFAPEALIDGRGRQVMWAWLLDNPGGEASELKRGWSGVYGLPRLLWLGKDGTLRMRVPPEYKSLRYHKQKWSAVSVEDGEKVALAGLNGVSCELKLKVDRVTARRTGLLVRASPDGAESTLIYYDAEEGCLVFEATASAGSGSRGFGRRVVEKAPFQVPEGKSLTLRVFIDQCVVEVFANDTQAITRRVYPARPDSTGVYLFSQGGPTVFKQVAAWEMMPSNPY